MFLTISLAQIDLIFGDPLANLAQVQVQVVEAAARSTDLLILPELWSTAYDLTNAHTHADKTNMLWAEIGRLAAAHNIHIVGSCLAHQHDKNSVVNRLTWHDRSGKIIATYDKLHLFRLMDEDQFLTAGDAPTLVEPTDSDSAIKAGLAICYDLRFPELFRNYALAGANLLIVPAEWPHPRLTHWQTLLRARAIENQCFVVACNRVGEVGQTRFFGHSAIIDPWGETVIEGNETASLLTATIDLGQVAAVRNTIPVFQDRRESAIYNK